MTKKSRKILLTISLIIILIGEIVFFFVVLPNGCDSVLDFMFGAKYDKTDDTLNLYGRDFGRFEYSNKYLIRFVL